jgi:cobalt/nickel transport system permease protein
VTALGTNVVLMGVVGVVVGWVVFRGLQKVLPGRAALVAPLAAVAAYVSVPVTALAFVGLYAVGGTAPIPLDSLTTAMLGWHAVIGLGEAAITGLVVASIVAVRPDLVHGARPVLAARTVELRPSGTEAAAA